MFLAVYLQHQVVLQGGRVAKARAGARLVAGCGHDFNIFEHAQCAPQNFAAFAH